MKKEERKNTVCKEWYLLEHNMQQREWGKAFLDKCNVGKNDWIAIAHPIVIFLLVGFYLILHYLSKEDISKAGIA
jgi:hypothetical protein